MEQNRKAGQNPPRVVAPTEEEEEEVVKYIIDEVKEGKYFSTILDSTPDITHVDQLSFVVRYLSKCGLPVERFVFCQTQGINQRN